MASQIVTTLKNKIKENDEELERFMNLAEENKSKYSVEKKRAEDVENEMLSLQRKIRLLEDKKDSVEDRLNMTTNKLDHANATLEDSDGGRQAMVGIFINQVPFLGLSNWKAAESGKWQH